MQQLALPGLAWQLIAELYYAFAEFQEMSYTAQGTQYSGKREDKTTCMRCIFAHTPSWETSLNVTFRRRERGFCFESSIFILF